MNQSLNYDKFNNGPNLVANNTMNEINELFNLNGGNNPYNNLSDVNVTNGLSTFYENYLKPNLFFIILAILFLGFLYWRYEKKNDIDNDENENKKKELEEIEKQKKMQKIKKQIKKIDTLIDNIENKNKNKNNNNKEQFKANLNPSYPVGVQDSYTNYLDNNIPVQVNNDQYIYKQQMPTKYEYLPTKTNTLETANAYTGLFNEYNNYLDQAYEKPLGFENNYNKSTHDAIEFATEKNRKSYQDMNYYVNNTNNQLMNNIN